MQIRRSRSDTDVILTLDSLTDIDISDAANGNIIINITDTVTTTLTPVTAVYDLKWTTDLGVITTIVKLSKFL